MKHLTFVSSPFQLQANISTAITLFSADHFELVSCVSGNVIKNHFDSNHLTDHIKNKDRSHYKEKKLHH
jgi:hypothetical protein